MQFLTEYGLFLAKVITIVFAILMIIGAIARSRHRHHAPDAPGEIEVRNLSDEYKDLKDTMQIEVLDAEAYKVLRKAEEKKEKAEAKEKKKAAKLLKKKVAEQLADDAEESSSENDTTETEDDDEELSRKPRMFVLNFIGDMEASSVHCLREEITAILSIAEPEHGDEVVLRLDSPGGVVHGYGHAAAQLQRLRDAEIPLTVSVDEVAASGGYMMACVADKIIAAPFAIVGSIGVIAELPNFNRLMKRFDIDYEQHTAGQFKRTLSVFGANSDEGRRKFQQELEDTHVLFKAFVSHYRPKLELDKVATGEHWYGSQAVSLQLVDELKTSDAYLLEHYESHDVFEVNYEFKKSLADKLSLASFLTLDRLMKAWYQRLSNRSNFVR